MQIAHSTSDSMIFKEDINAWFAGFISLFTNNLDTMWYSRPNKSVASFRLDGSVAVCGEGIVVWNGFTSTRSELQAGHNAWDEVNVL